MKKELIVETELSENTEKEQPPESCENGAVSHRKNKIIELRNISKSFDGEKVLDGIDLSINDKEFITFLGPSGCGKTTTLRIIGGFESPDVGDVFFDGEKINDLPPYKRQVNTVFQKYALFPHLNVYDNIAFGLRIAKVKENEISERVAEMLKLREQIGESGVEAQKAEEKYRAIRSVLDQYSPEDALSILESSSAFKSHLGDLYDTLRAYYSNK